MKKIKIITLVNYPFLHSVQEGVFPAGKIFPAWEAGSQKGLICHYIYHYHPV